MAQDSILKEIIEKIWEATEIGRAPTYILLGKEEMKRIQQIEGFEQIREDDDATYFIFGCEVLITHKRSFFDVI